MIDTVKARPNVSDIPTVSDFPDVFPEELSGLPPQREIEFAIDVVPGATPASITPYGMAPLDQVYHCGELSCFLSRRKTVHFDYVLIIDN